MTSLRNWVARLPRLARHFGTDRSGASALEFAILAGPVIFLLLAVIEAVSYTHLTLPTTPYV